jgi:hypothetical protein
VAYNLQPGRFHHKEGAMLLTYLFPILVVAGIGFYYLRIYGRGKAAGGGFMEGVAAQQRDRWKAVITEGESIVSWGSGVKWRPAWQVLLASNMPIMRLVWPTEVFEMVMTDRGRILVGRSGTLGLKDPKAYERTAVQAAEALEEKPGLAMKLNPMWHAFGKDHKTYEVTLRFAGDPLRMLSVPGTFLQALSGNGSPRGYGSPGA